ncbi:zinc finger X-linked protein ZXDB-like [Sinocyclocheilus rhinocerous]|uniref:zinc finger X-linked protein ZXDB-like n=1 Tax=Sinocyclocheilus rhinocerous TaxID=307959 RepID=UPI0007B91F55|nr:PREDICTED: zinc finger X-linked protein ZXDB-like [Sinocyclocheilus rhinocerous]
MCCCYRDTKMEIQGLTDTKNTQSQHGVPLHTTFSQQTTASAIHARTRLTENVISGLSGSLDLESDANNNRARSSPLRVAENGSALSLQNNHGKKYDVQFADAELGDVNASKQRVFNELDLLPSEFDRAVEHDDNDLQMALPLLDTESCEQRLTTERILSNTSTSSNKSPEELYVVFNIVHKEDDSKERQMSFQHKAEVNGSSSPKTLSSPVYSDENFNRTSKSGHLSSHSNLNSRSETTDQIVRHEICLLAENRDPILSEGYARGSQTPKVSTVEMLSNNLVEHSTEELMQCVTKYNSPAFVPESRVASEINIMDYANQESSSNGDCGPDGTPIPVHETFSGTIMINNQSIIVTIENGILTLATPPEGCAYKEDGMISLKEHLGMKDNEDLVLLNYDGGSKSIGKISNVNSSLQDEPKARFAGSDSELNLADCSLLEMGVTLDSCSSIKQEGTVCAIEDDSSICQNSKSKPSTCEQLQPINLLTVSGLTKKGSVVKYRCSQPGCSSTFDTRQNLKIHLVLHTEDQRPFKCTVEGCDWSFTTSYKLKRHLQSHDKVRPYKCEWENCGRRFTTVYNLKAHVKAHDQENAFICEVCSERFRTATRLTNHQRTHFEPERPHKCEFPGCEKTFITFSALFSHNRTHFREMAQFTCTYPGCDKRYDKACRLKIHLRSHTGERPFVCDSDSCGWTFTSMSKLLRHKRKHDDDRRFACPEEGCGKSFTRAEHLKGHSITHLGTKPFECPVEGCNAKFSARSSLYIHSKKHKQDGVSLRSRCPVAGCTKHFSSRSSLKTHMLKHHNLSPGQLDDTTTLTPSSELTSTSQAVSAPSGPAGAELSSLDLSSLFSSIPACPGTTAVGSEGSTGAGSFSMDMPLVNTRILTIDPASVGSALNGAKTVDPLILAAGQDMGVHVLDTGLGAGGGGGVLPHARLHLDDVQTVNPEELGTLTALAIQSTASSEQLHTLNSCNPLTVESPSTLTPTLSSSLSQSLSSLTSALQPALSSSLVPSLSAPLSSMALTATPVPELLSPQAKADLPGSETAVGPLLSRVEVMAQSDGSKGMCQFVFPSHSGSYSGQRGHQGMDDPASDGDLAFQLSSQTSCSHSQLTVDLPVNILQEPTVMAEDENGSDNSQFTGSTINLQDLE